MREGDDHKRSGMLPEGAQGPWGRCLSSWYFLLSSWVSKNGEKREHQSLGLRCLNKHTASRGKPDLLCAGEVTDLYGGKNKLSACM